MQIADVRIVSDCAHSGFLRMEHKHWTASSTKATLNIRRFQPSDDWQRFVNVCLLRTDGKNTPLLVGAWTGLGGRERCEK